VGKAAHPEYFAYSTSKFAVIGMTQSMAFDLGKFGITVNAICPGVIMNTGLRNAAEADAARRGLPVANQRLDGIPLRRTGEPSDIANAIMFLLSDQGDYMTGQSLNITGGLWMN
jgi:NAD(P)-dependent dehydrogenase (short-subunit alcohol dehydrogenase family)